MDELREQLIEAIRFRDTQKLLQLKENLAVEALLKKYILEDGTVDIPIEAWMEDLPTIAKRFGVGSVLCDENLTNPTL